MKTHIIDKKSNELLIFFTGWGCDEYEFEHLESDSDVLLLYDYTDLKLDFDFSKYGKINLIAFSAGIFVASIMNFDFEINKNIAISGNPYLFDVKSGLSKEIQDILCNITENNADDFAKNYLIKTDKEWEIYHHSKRTTESCKAEFESLKELYYTNKHKIKDIYNIAIMGEDDKIFNLATQKEFYGNRLKIIKNARHSLFFRINNYKQIINISI